MPVFLTAALLPFLFNLSDWQNLPAILYQAAPLVMPSSKNSFGKRFGQGCPMCIVGCSWKENKVYRLISFNITNEVITGLSDKSQSNLDPHIARAGMQIKLLIFKLFTVKESISNFKPANIISYRVEHFANWLQSQIRSHEYVHEERYKNILL